MISPIVPVYRRSDTAMVRGEGVYLFDDAGRRYLDGAAGIAVVSLGHCHPQLVAALKTQAAELWHCSNFFTHPGLERFSHMLVAASGFADAAFFCSSGAEAVEAGLKFARKYMDETGRPGRYRTITMEGGFHGRSFAGISASGAERVTKGYGPLLEGFDSVPFADIAALEAAITDETAAILLEPVLGEGGVKPLPIEFLQVARRLADTHGLLLFFDEVQCGMGRTGHLFAHEPAGIRPDIVTLAKGIGGGFPLGACLVTRAVADVLTPGCHGSTYGSNPLAMAVGEAVFTELQRPALLEHVRQVGAYALTQLQALVREFPDIFAEARGLGLMLGLETKVSAYGLMDVLREDGLLVAAAGDRVLRIVPPLVIETRHIDEAANVLRGVVAKI